jgi:hypothetical protein
MACEPTNDDVAASRQVVTGGVTDSSVVVASAIEL